MMSEAERENRFDDTGASECHSYVFLGDGHTLSVLSIVGPSDAVSRECLFGIPVN